jgi:uncharacterized metal-binding protein
MNGSKCSCDTAPKLIFPCSGAADVGAIADLAARKMTREGIGKMACLAGIGAGSSGIIESTKAAAKVLVIDGCPVDCGKKVLEKAGFSDFKHMRVTEQGFEKGKSPATENAIDAITTKGGELLVC